MFAMALLSWLQPAQAQLGGIYPMEAYRRVDPKLISHTEESPIIVPIIKPAALAIAGSNRLVVAGESEVVLLDSSGQTIHSVTLNEPATCAATQKDGTILVGSRHTIHRYSASLVFQEEMTTLGEQAHLTCIAAGSNAVFACDAGQRRIWHFNMEGALVNILSAPVNAPGRRFVIPSPGFDAVPRPEGKGFWVVNPGYRKVMKLDETGRWILEWGHSAPDTYGFCGCCNPVHIALLSDGSIVTAEKKIPRVKVHNSAGTVTGVVAEPDDFGREQLITDLAVDAKDRVLILEKGKQRIRIFIPKPDYTPPATSPRSPNVSSS